VHTILKRPLLALLLLAASLVSAQTGNVEKKEMTAASPANQPCSPQLKGITHFKDNDIRFTRSDGKVLFVDPTSGPNDNAVKKSGFLKADLILITHPHDDHFKPWLLQTYIKANPQVVIAGPAMVVAVAKAYGIEGVQLVEPNKSYNFSGFEVSTLPAYFDSKDWNHPKDQNWVGYVFTLNSVRYYVTGDTQPMPQSANIKADVIFPLLFGCGGNSAQALEMVKTSGAKLVVPVHTSGQVETIKKYIASLPQGVQSAYFIKGEQQPSL
jgi:L-ascorbate metabolism protein UlaG (beta-lactamase superfamily)